MKTKQVYCKLLGEPSLAIVSRDQGIPLQAKAGLNNGRITVYILDAQGRTLLREAYPVAEAGGTKNLRLPPYEISCDIDLRDQVAGITFREMP